jgi:hypothetical protein
MLYAAHSVFVALNEISIHRPLGYSKALFRKTEMFLRRTDVNYLYRFKNISRQSLYFNHHNRTVLKITMDIKTIHSSNQNLVDINLSEYAKGLYLIKIKTNNQVSTEKIRIQ